MILYLKNKIFGALVIAALLIFVFLYFRGSMRAFHSDSLNAPLGTVTKGDLIQRVTIAGIVAPRRRTLIMAPYPGYVQKLFVRTGDHVKANEPVVSVTQSLQTQEQVFPLRAPVAGTVVNVKKNEGEFVKDGDPKEFIVAIDDLSRLFVVADVPEIDYLKLKVGQEVIVKASSILSRSYRGVVRDLTLAAEDKREDYGRTQVEFATKIEILDQDDQIKPGMSTIIDIIAQKKSNVLLLRHEYVHQKGNQFFVVLANGKRQNIDVGLQNDEMFEIRSGLNEGDKIKPVNFLRMMESESG